MENADTFSYHRQQPNVSVDTHIKSQKVALGKSLEAKKKIYLDTKYWLHFRDVFLGRMENDAILRSFEILSEYCDTGLVVCPISEDVFVEVTKQSDENTLGVTIDVIDRLSGGVSLISQTERIQAEIMHFFRQSTCDADNLHPLRHLVWTKLGYSLGTRIPNIPALLPQEELVIQKSFFDHMWNMPLSELCKAIGYKELNNMPRMPDLSHLLNEDADIEREKNLQFKKVFLDEIFYMAIEIKPLLNEAMEYLYNLGTGNVATETEQKAANESKTLVNVVCNLFRLEKEGIYFPTLKVGAAIHAAVIMDKGRNFSANDYYDFRHAQAAVPYCDYFFTEKNLKHLLTINSLAFDKEYNCEIASAPKDVQRALEGVGT